MADSVSWLACGMTESHPHLLRWAPLLFIFIFILRGTHGLLSA